MTAGTPYSDHSCQQRILTAPVRRRIWHSTRILDVLSSFVLSRPKSLPVVRCVPNAIESENAESAFHAIVDGCTLLEDIVDTLSKDNILHVPAAEDLLARLRQWGHGLPMALRQFRFRQAADSSSAVETVDRQHLIGNIHVSCVYYFAVILVTRPYLIAYLTSRLHGKAPDHLISDPVEASDVNIKNNKVSKLAQVCVSSALYMVDMCQRAKAAGLAFGNLCLLKYVAHYLHTLVTWWLTLKSPQGMDLWCRPRPRILHVRR